VPEKVILVAAERWPPRSGWWRAGRAVGVFL